MGDLITPDLVIFFALIQSVVFLLLIRFMDLYEREPFSLLVLMFVWGAAGAGILAPPINGFVSGVVYEISPEVQAVLGAAIAAPLGEETTKGLALVVAFFVSWGIARRFGGLEFEGVTDGIVYGAAVGLGFSFTEDIFYYLVQAGGGELGLATYLDRVDFFGLGQLTHALFTAAFGAGLGLATWSHSWAGRLGFSALGLAVAMAAHAAFNGLAPAVLVYRYGFEDTAAWMGGTGIPGVTGVPADLALRMGTTSTLVWDRVLPFLTVLFVLAFVGLISLWLRYQRRVLRSELAEEADLGLIGAHEQEVMPCYWRRSLWYWGLLRGGKLERWRLDRRTHNALADLAFLKWRTRRVGSDWGKVEKQRRRVKALLSTEVVE